LKRFELTIEPKYTAAGAAYPNDQYLRKRFTYKTRFDDIVKMYREEGDTILIPRALCPIGDDRRSTGKPVEWGSMVIGPRNQEQRRIYTESAALMQKGVSHIIQASTGIGKTFLGMWVAQTLGLKTLVIVPKEDIKNQWRDAAIKFCGLSESDIGYVQGPKCDVSGKKFVIGMVQSIYKDKYPEWLSDEFGLIIFDEVHIMGATEFSKACFKFSAKYRLGLSATPYRKDGRDMVFKAHIGEVGVISEHLALKPKVIRVLSSFRLPRVKTQILDRNTGKPKFVMAPLPFSAGKDGHVKKMLAGCAPRNKQICEFAAAAYKKGRNTIIFSDLKEKHLVRLVPLLRALGVQRNDIAFYVGGMKEAEREVAKTKPVILATYSMTAMATDIPWLDTCVLATPRSDVVQIVGRILREYPDKKQPIVFDVIDADAEPYVKFATKRLGWYKKVRATVLNK